MATIMQLTEKSQAAGDYVAVQNGDSNYRVEMPRVYQFLGTSALTYNDDIKVIIQEAITQMFNTVGGPTTSGMKIAASYSIPGVPNGLSIEASVTNYSGYYMIFGVTFTQKANGSVLFRVKLNKSTGDYEDMKTVVIGALA